MASLHHAVGRKLGGYRAERVSSVLGKDNGVVKGWMNFQGAVNIVAILLTGWATYSIIERILQDRRDPVIMERTEALNSPVLEGESLNVRIYREKVRSCPVQSIRAVQDMDGNSYDIPDAIVPGGQVGTEYTDAIYDVSDLPPGDYQLYVTLTYLCRDANHIIAQPPTMFRIVSRESNG